MQKRYFLISTLALFLASLFMVTLPPWRASAQAGSASDLIAAVNAYRASNGLAAYTVDSSLMSEAQSHSEYQASIDTCTHQRADGSGPGDHGVSSENIACGMNMSVDGAIYVQWQDALHLATMLGPETGLVGAGMAISASGVVYYTLDVVRLTGDFEYRAPTQPTTEGNSANGSTIVTGPTDIPVYSGPFYTATPQEDGSVIHTIQYGQTLIQIAEAYGISLDDIYAANTSIDPTQPVYYEGDTLVIRFANTKTPVPSATLTPLPPTRTPRPTRTATVTRTATRSSSQAAATITAVIVGKNEVNQRWVAYAVILVSGLGFAVVVVKGFLKKT